MNQPTPAIVAQNAVRRLPRKALVLLCLAYVLPGFIGRAPWRNADITAFGYMWGMAQGHTSWIQPQLLGFPTEADALLPYWLGAWAIQGLSPLSWFLTPDMAVRIPFAMLLLLVLLTTWYAVYGLARSPQAQPVMFAFGGEAHPADYARAMADGGLLALMACLGLALLSHETTAALAQLAGVALSFFAVVQLMRGKPWATVPLLMGLVALALSGAPTIAALLGLGSAAISALGQAQDAPEQAPRAYSESLAAGGDKSALKSWRPSTLATVIVLCTVASAGAAFSVDLWRWRVQPMPEALSYLKGMARLLLWFGWPAMPLAVWTVWRWRHLWRSPHLALPLWYLGVAVLATLLTPAADRSLLLGLPALAALAAFALPTLSRAVTALIDWFTLLFFSGWALVVWVVWLAMQTGFPTKPAANVARLAPGYLPELSWPALLTAVVASAAWIALVRWRVGRNRSAIWKSLVLPAGGATLGWVLVMTLLLGPLDYALSNQPIVKQVTVLTRTAPGCVESRGLSAALVTALRYHGALSVEPSESDCPWLLATEQPDTYELGINGLRWESLGPVLYGPRGGEGIQIYQRIPR